MGSLFFNDDDRSEPEDVFGGAIEGAKLGLLLARIAVLPFLILFGIVGVLIQSFGGKDDKDGE